MKTASERRAEETVRNRGEEGGGEWPAAYQTSRHLHTDYKIGTRPGYPPELLTRDAVTKVVRSILAPCGVKKGSKPAGDNY